MPARRPRHLSARAAALGPAILLFLRANGLLWTAPSAVVLGVALNLLAGNLVGVPLVASSVVIGQLVPGAVTLTLGWTLVDRWPTHDLALPRDGRRLDALRVLATVSVCLTAAVIAGWGRLGPTIAGTLWVLAVCVGAARLSRGWWWAPVFLAQYGLLSAAAYRPPHADVLTVPSYGAAALGVAALASVLTSRDHLD